MCENTNISFRFKPSTALNQRITYSQYYADNVAKGGVFLQECGWMGVANLWNGAISDSMYQKVTKIWEQQKKFSENDVIDKSVIPFTTILDKGYCCTLYAWSNGKKLIQQPVFAKCDQKFKAQDTLALTSIATDYLVMNVLLTLQNDLDI